MVQIVPPSQENIQRAADRLRAGGIVGLPTETVYGLAADTFNPAAIRHIYHLKGRPSNNPLIAHVFDLSQASELMTQSTLLPQIEKLTTAFWPGPLTLVVPKSDRVPPQATAGLPTIAVRSPSHPIARQLLAAFGSAISAPSANRSGHVSPTSAQHVAKDYENIADDLLILDGGPCAIGIESTVLDLTSSPPRVLRPGSVTWAQLQSIIGEIDIPTLTAQSISPGTALRHYAPRTPAELVTTEALRNRLLKSPSPVAVLTHSMQREDARNMRHHLIKMPSNAEAYAQKLYEALRQADTAGCELILIEQPPVNDDDVWRAIHDRLRRAVK